MAHAIGAIELTHVLHNFQASLIVEVHIDIGHFTTFERKKTLKHEAVFERVERGNIHSIGHNSTRSRATTRTYTDAVLLCPAHILLHDQKVIGKSFVANNAIFILKALFYIDACDLCVLPVGAIFSCKTLFAFATKTLFGCLAFGKPWKLGQVHMRPIELKGAFVSNRNRFIDRLGHPGKNAAHLIFGLEIKLRARKRRFIRFVEVSALTNAAQNVARLKVFFGKIVHVVGGNHPNIKLARKRHDALSNISLGKASPIVARDAVILNFEIKILAK